MSQRNKTPTASNPFAALTKVKGELPPKQRSAPGAPNSTKPKIEPKEVPLGVQLTKGNYFDQLIRKKKEEELEAETSKKKKDQAPKKKNDLKDMLKAEGGYQNQQKQKEQEAKAQKRKRQKAKEAAKKAETDLVVEDVEEPSTVEEPAVQAVEDQAPETKAPSKSKKKKKPAASEGETEQVGSQDSKAPGPSKPPTAAKNSSVRGPNWHHCRGHIRWCSDYATHH
eukprot:NODE_1286_length_1795_cov_58.248206_g1221_i0.p2 GENE.NODE_1286_length_1795_cov_58.248206_g1221_i0~~NODE_1286_length_1795_cov_58.248206_g1221_i0.p2  ORF type:complete len:246 (-),score=80.62 NODE_1286_length_1795_cov_58.248206_g1221_i0:1058-1732(-)